VLNYGVLAMKAHGIDLLTNFPNNRSIKVVGKTVWRRIGQEDLLLFPIDWTFLEETFWRYQWLLKPLTSLANALSPMFFRAKAPSGASMRDIKIEKNPPVDDAFDDFWNRVRDKYPIMYVRDAAFLNWRYLQNPRRSYTMFVAKDKGEVVGYVICRATRYRHLHAGFIVDFLVESSERGERAGEMLTAEAVRCLRLSNINIVISMMPPRFHEGTIMRRLNFMVCPRPMKPLPVILFIGEANEELPKSMLDQLENWFLQLGDFDIV
jgi:L-amino acid N-acyltransferase YncA